MRGISAAILAVRIPTHPSGNATLNAGSKGRLAESNFLMPGRPLYAMLQAGPELLKANYGAEVVLTADDHFTEIADGNARPLLAGDTLHWQLPLAFAQSRIAGSSP